MRGIHQADDIQSYRRHGKVVFGFISACSADQALLQTHVCSAGLLADAIFPVHLCHASRQFWSVVACAHEIILCVRCFGSVMLTWCG